MDLSRLGVVLSPARLEPVTHSPIGTRLFRAETCLVGAVGFDVAICISASALLFTRMLEKEGAG